MTGAYISGPAAHMLACLRTSTSPTNAAGGTVGTGGTDCSAGGSTRRT